MPYKKKKKENAETYNPFIYLITDTNKFYCKLYFNQIIAFIDVTSLKDNFFFFFCYNIRTDRNRKYFEFNR